MCRHQSGSPRHRRDPGPRRWIRGRPWSGRPSNSLTSRPTSVRTLGPVQPIQRSPRRPFAACCSVSPAWMTSVDSTPAASTTWPRTSGSRRAIGPCRARRRRSLLSATPAPPWDSCRGRWKGRRGPSSWLPTSTAPSPSALTDRTRRNEASRPGSPPRGPPGSTSWVGPDDIDVVGATPLDMKAAHAAGATAVGAAAGRYSSDDLKTIGRAFVLRSLEGNISRAPARRWQRGLRVVSACGRTRRSGCTRACPGAPRAVQRRSCRHTAHT